MITGKTLKSLNVRGLRWEMIQSRAGTVFVGTGEVESDHVDIIALFNHAIDLQRQLQEMGRVVRTNTFTIEKVNRQWCDACGAVTDHDGDKCAVCAAVGVDRKIEPLDLSRTPEQQELHDRMMKSLLDARLQVIEQWMERVNEKFAESDRLREVQDDEVECNTNDIDAIRKNIRGHTHKIEVQIDHD